MNETPRKKRTWKVVLLAVLLGLVFLLALMPTIASSAFVRGRVLARVNASLAGKGTLGIADWSLSWFGKNRVEGIVFSDAAGQEVVAVKELEISSGLLSIARTRDLGLVRIVEPVIDYAIPTDPASGEAPANPGERIPDSGAADPKAPSMATEKVEAVELPVSGVLQVEKGRVKLAPPGDQAPVVLRQLAGSIILNRALGAIELTIKALNGAEAAPLELTLKLAPSEGNRIDPAALKVSGGIRIKALDLQPILALAAGFSGAVPTGQGLLSTDVNFEATGTEDASFSGYVSTDGLQLAGGALGGDAPDIGAVKLVFEGAWDKGGLRFKQTTLRSLFANINVDGTLPRAGTGALKMTGQVQLVSVAAAFPQTLKLQEGLALHSGVLDIRADLDRSGETLGVDAQVTIDQLAGTVALSNGQARAVSLEDAVTVSVKGTVTDKDLDIKVLKLESSFLNGSGSGNLDNLTVTLNAKLAPALAELSKFVDLGLWQARGDAQLTLSVEKQADDDRKLDLTLSSESLFLANGEQVLLPQQPVELGVLAHVDIPAEGFLDRVKTLEITLQSLVAKGRITGKDMVLPRGKGDAKAPLTIGSLDIGTTLNLGMLSAMIPPPEEGEGLVLGGMVTISGGLHQDGAAWVTDKLELRANRFRYQKGEQHYEQDELVVSSGISVDLEKKQAVLTNFSTTLGVGTITLPTLSIANWEDVVNTLEGSVNAQVDLQKSMVTLASFTGAEDVVPVTGAAVLDLKMQPVENGSVIGMDLAVSDFAYRMKNGEVIREKSVKLDGQLGLAKDQNTVQVREMSFQADPFSLSGTAVLTDLKSNGRLKAQGTFAYDLVKLSPYIKLITGQDIAPTGAYDQPFVLDFPLGSKTGEVQAPGYFKSGFKMDQLVMYGLDIRDLTIPLVLSNQQFSTSIEADINDGTLRFYPTVVLDAPKPTLTIPTNSLVLSQIQLNNQVCNDLLGRIHPLFKGASVGGGRLSLSMDYLEVPTGDKVTEEIRFAGTITLQDVQLTTSGMLDILMSVIKVKERAYTLEEEVVTFVAEQGRITCSPLKFKADGRDVVLHGSIGFDQSLAYKVSLPVTEDLVGRDAFKFLEGQLISVPIGGTVSKPKLDRKAFQQEVGVLVKGALKKAATDLLQKEAGKLLEGLFK